VVSVCFQHLIEGYVPWLVLLGNLGERVAALDGPVGVALRQRFGRDLGLCRRYRLHDRRLGYRARRRDVSAGIDPQPVLTSNLVPQSVDVCTRA